MADFDKQMTEEKEEKLTIQEALPEALDRMEESLEPLVVEIDGEYDSGARVLHLSARCMDSEHVESVLENIFFDIFYYIPADVSGVKFKLDLTTFSDPSFKNKKHTYHMATSVDAMPGTAEVTRRQWNYFENQLTYVKDGKETMRLPRPEPFVDDFEE